MVGIFLVIAVSIDYSLDGLLGKDNVNLAEESKRELVNNQKKYLYEPSQITTVGNHTYININTNEYPANRINEILELLAAFEKNHPDLQITNWHIQEQNVGPHYYQKVFGIWIDHRPR